MTVIPYGSPEWYDARMGLPTSSNFHKILTPGGKPSKSETTRTYMLQLIAERLLHIPSDEEVKVLMMERGKLLESDAARQFSEVYDYQLEPGGFLANKQLKAGASPDAFIKGRAEAVEIKSPAAHTLIGYHLDGLGTDYKPQVQGQILVGNLDAVHFYAWHPRCPAFYLMTLPDYEYIEKLKTALEAFTTQLDTDTALAHDIGHFQSAANPWSPDQPDAVNVLDAG